jgi:GT2 family glycosyltransferase
LPDDNRFSGIREVFGVPGAAPIISGTFVNTFRNHGELYDSRMFMYYEDVDLDWRARRAGWRIYMVYEAVAWHDGSDPGETLRVEALSNRFRSVLRNCYTRDLAFNLLVIVLHCALRLVFSPRSGLALIRLVIPKGVEALRLRRPAQVPRRVFIHWFKDARQQTSQVPLTYCGRLRSFLQRRTGNS